MNSNYYIITFTNKLTVFASAFNESEAIILAQATMIKNGNTYDVDNVRETRHIEDAKLTNFCV